MKSIAIILARGGSKRLPLKNILEIHGKPMIAWTIEATLESQCFDRVLVSTDDHEIARISLEFGAQVPFLRSAGSDDHTPSSSASIIALDQAEKYWNESYDSVAQLMANCPLRDKNDIQKSYEYFELTGKTAQISSFRYGWMNPWWAARLDAFNKPTFLFPEAMNSRSQDLFNLFCPSGAIWISRAEILKKFNTFYSPGFSFLPLNWMSALDIDDSEDLEMAKACFILKNIKL